jgi:carboxyl-terminal processing protease
MNSSRRAFLAALAASTCLPAGAARALSEKQRLEDFDALWSAIDQGYAYFGGARADWRRARDGWRARARSARTRPEFVAALEGALERLHDDHLWMSEHAPDSPRRVPAETDIWASWRSDSAVIEAVRTYGDADVAGLRPGHVVRSIAGLPAPMAVRDRIGAGETAQVARDWALRRALAGPRDGVLRVEVAEAQGPKAYDVERKRPAATNGPGLIGRRVGQQRDLGYVRLKASLSDPAFAETFEGAIQYLAGTRAMILDLRDVTGPFDDPTRARAATLAILQRFTTRPGPWQARETRAGERLTDSIAARPGTYPAPLVVLVDRWTAGEGEALAAGLNAVAGARLVGTRMAGLRGALQEARLPNSSITVRYPGQKTFHPDGTPREALRPEILVDLAAPQGGPGDPILYQGLKLLEK